MSEEKVQETLWERGRIPTAKNYKLFSSLIPGGTIIQVSEWTWAEFVERLTALELWLAEKSEEYTENVRRLQRERANTG